MDINILNTFGQNASLPSVTQLGTVNSVQSGSIGLLEMPSAAGSATEPGGTIIVTNSSTVVFDGNPNRKYARIERQAPGDFALGFGGAPVAGEGIVLSSSLTTYEINAKNLWKGTVNAILGTGRGTLRVVEW